MSASLQYFPRAVICSEGEGYPMVTYPAAPSPPITVRAMSLGPCFSGLCSSLGLSPSWLLPLSRRTLPAAVNAGRLLGRCTRTSTTGWSEVKECHDAALMLRPTATTQSGHALARRTTGQVRKNATMSGMLQRLTARGLGRAVAVGSSPLLLLLLADRLLPEVGGELLHLEWRGRTKHSTRLMHILGVVREEYRQQARIVQKKCTVGGTTIQALRRCSRRRNVCFRNKRTETTVGMGGGGGMGCT